VSTATGKSPFAHRTTASQQKRSAGQKRQQRLLGLGQGSKWPWQQQQQGRQGWQQLLAPRPYGAGQTKRITVVKQQILLQSSLLELP
jgi:hypothetical protein